MERQSQKKRESQGERARESGSVPVSNRARESERVSQRKRERARERETLARYGSRICLLRSFNYRGQQYFSSTNLRCVGFTNVTNADKEIATGVIKRYEIKRENVNRNHGLKHMHTHAPTHRNTQTHTWTHTHVRTCTHMHARTYKHTHACMHIHTHERTYTPAHTHTHIHIHK